MNYRIQEKYSLSKPDWIRGKVSWREEYNEVRTLLRKLDLNSVCVEAACPNRGECWEARHVTFMILGKACTRSCRFCNVTSGAKGEPDVSEPHNVAIAAEKLDAKYVVVTSVTRDDLPDKGAEHFVRTVKEVKAKIADVLVELLIPDFGADRKLLRKVAFSGVEVVGHNIEAPRALYPDVRPQADYNRSLDVLRILNAAREEGANILVKSSIILGLGEKEEEILRILMDLKGAGVDIVYMGQYLSPSRDHWPVKKYYSPEEFESFEEKASQIGFGAVCAGPMVRSSYQAYSSFLKCKNLQKTAKN